MACFVGQFSAHRPLMTSALAHLRTLCAGGWSLLVEQAAQKELRMATFNARAETVESKPVFRDAFKRKRCLIPMSGYYEWQNTPSGKQPWWAR